MANLDKGQSASMKRSGASFKYVLMKCKISDSKDRADNIAMEFVKKRYYIFLKRKKIVMIRMPYQQEVYF